MAMRKIVRIDEDLCNGCGQCVPSCAEGAIQIIDGKARLVGENLCDGLGACLGDCPEGAITIEEREAEEFDETAVERHLAGMKKPAPEAEAGSATPAPLAAMPAGHHHGPAGGGCPGSRMMQFASAAERGRAAPDEASAGQPSELRQWPIQLHLVPPMAPYFQGAHVLLAADCTAFAAGDFHARFLRGKALAVACPKLDQGQEAYLQKLVALFDQARIDTLTVLVMQVPCCAGLVALAREAAARAQRKVPIKQVVVGVQGELLKEEWL
jgi:NAD-dependent dihydropyrimidine dehydrogenase PreA subunit